MTIATPGFNRKLAAILVIFTSITISACLQTPTKTLESRGFPPIKTIQDLSEQAAFSFAIMSDNKGDSRKNSTENARMAKWIKDSNDQFVIGLGDHLKRGWDNSFLEMIKQDPWWNRNFYPNIADGENEYYGTCQEDRYAGGQLLKDMNFSQHKNVIIRDNGSEYYAKIPVNGYTVHLIQLHYPDSPENCYVAFSEDSRQYLSSTLKGIKKEPKDIIILGAHSRSGFWIGVLDDDTKKLVMEKADLVLSATTHYFQRKILTEYEHTGALLINTGSVNYPLAIPLEDSHGGYVQVSVLESPLRLVVQYINVEDLDDMELADRKHAIIKVIEGDISFIDFYNK